MSDLRTFFTNRRSLFLGRKSHIVGVLNLTPDSFSDGGDYVDIKAASLHAHQMVKSGASIIDIGGESTRPGYDPVTVEEEIHRVVPFIKKNPSVYTGFIIDRYIKERCCRCCPQGRR